MSVVLRGIVEGDSVVPSVAGGDKVDAGTYTATVSISGTSVDAGNYVVAAKDATTNYTINAKTLSASVNNDAIVSRAYDGTTSVSIEDGKNPITLTGVCSQASVVDDVAATYTSFVYTDKNAGTNKTVEVAGIALSGAKSGNYSVGGYLSAAATTSSVTAKEVPVTYTDPAASDLIYDATDKASKFSAVVPTSFIAAGDSQENVPVTLTTKAETGKLVSDAGEHTLQAYITNTNYSVTTGTLGSDTHTFTIVKKGLTIGSVDVSTRAYDGTTTVNSSQTVTINLSGLYGEDAFDATCTSAQYTTAAAETGKQVAVTGVAITAKSTTNANNYEMLANSGTFGPSEATGNEITKKEVGVTWSGYETKVYDGMPTHVQATINSADLIEGDNVELTITGNDNYHAGTYTATISDTLSGISGNNYQLSSTAQKSCTYVITPAKLKATFSGAEVFYKQAIPEDAKRVDVTGFVGNENAESAAGYTAPTMNFTKQSSTSQASLMSNSAMLLASDDAQLLGDDASNEGEDLPVGEYTFTPTGGSASDYTFEYEEGTLKVKSRFIEFITASSYSQDYDGNGHSITVTVNPDIASDVVVTYYTSEAAAQEGYQGSDTPITYTDVTNGPITQWYRVDPVEGKEGEYEPAYGSATIEILQKIVNYSAQTTNGTKTYDGTTDASNNVALVAQGFASADASAVQLSYDANFSDANVGTNKSAVFSNIAITGSKAGNYKLATEGIDMATSVNVVPAALTYTWSGNSSQDLVYSGVAKDVKPVFSGVFGSDNLNLSVVGGNNTAASDDDYSVTASIQNDNYTITDSSDGKTISTTYKITKAVLTASFVNEQIKKGSSVSPQYKVNVSGFVNGENATTATSYSAPTASCATFDSTTVGSYAATVSGGSAANYSFTYVNGTISVVDADTMRITFTPYTGTYDGQEHTFTYSIEDGTTAALITDATVTFYSDSARTQQVASTNVKDATDGTTFYAKVVKDGYETINDVDVTTIIYKKSAGVTWDSTTTFTYDATEHSIGATVNTQDVIAGDTVNAVLSDNTLTDAGTTTATVTGLDNSNYTLSNSATLTCDLTVNKAPVTITSGTAQKTYDGTALTNSDVTYSTPQFMTGQGVDITFTGSQTAVGQSQNTFTYVAKDGTNLDNYVITSEYGTLTVVADSSKINVYISGATGDYVYDGTTRDVSGYTITKIEGSETFTASDVAFSGTAEIIKTDVNYNTTDGVVAYAMGLDATQFAAKDPATYPNVVFTITDGSLLIRQRGLTLSTNSVKVSEYDGQAHQDQTVTASGYVTDEELTYSNYVSQTDATTGNGILNSVDVTDSNTAKVSNYTITKNFGLIQIGKRSVTLTSGDVSTAYDGAAHTGSGQLTVGGSGMVSGESFVPTYTNSITHVGTAQNTFTYAANTGTKADNYNVSVTYGTLTVTQRAITLTSADAEFTYDGASHSATTVTDTITGETTAGFVSGEGFDYTNFATITNAGSLSNTFTYSAKANTLVADYNINVVNGTLTVNKADPTAAMFSFAPIVTSSYDANTRTANVEFNDSLGYTGMGAVTVYYVNGSTTSTEAPKNAGTYTVKIAVAAGDNFNATAAGTYLTADN